MMISPEGYYEMELKGKSAEDIAKRIRGIKQEIGHLKKAIEHPDYRVTILPDERTRLWCNRMYLERAITAYIEAGGTYTQSKAEQEAAAFDEAATEIARIELSIGGFFGGYEMRIVSFTETDAKLVVVPSPFDKEQISSPKPEWSYTKEEFLEEFKELHIGEWRKHYDAIDYGVCIMDGTQWELRIEFTDGKKITYDGSNAYPYNFDRFSELVGYEIPQEDVGEDE